MCLRTVGKNENPTIYSSLWCLCHTDSITSPCAERLLEQLRQRIQQRLDSLPEQKPYTWKSVQGCAVIGPDMLWYRGQLLEVLGGHVKVRRRRVSKQMM